MLYEGWFTYQFESHCQLKLCCQQENAAQVD